MSDKLVKAVVEQARSSIVVDKGVARKIMRVLQNADVMHFEEPDIEPIWDPEEVRKMIGFLEDKLEVPVEERWKYEV